MKTNEITDLNLSAYDYDLPSHLIADRPAKRRDLSRLMVYRVSQNKVEHHIFKDLPSILDKNTLLLLNESKVFPCRLLGQKSSGGKCELFLLSLIRNERGYECLIKSRGKKNLGDLYCFGEMKATISEVADDGSFRVQFNCSDNELKHMLHTQGEIPIPPYIRDGIADEQDHESYQTVYAKQVGSVAAPTAGLHFTDEVFQALANKGIQKEFVTLHVGAGTFRPVQSEKILDHTMHSEFFEIENRVMEKINHHQGPVVAVGTTTLRVLESCVEKENKKLSPPKQEKPWSTDIFLYPGKEVHSINGLLTNFHLPKSTLLMLVSSLIGREKALELYHLAIKENYRFFSYGDAMLILRD